MPGLPAQPAPPSTAPPGSPWLVRLEWLTGVLSAAWSILLYWRGVSWALRPRQFMLGDEYDNLGWTLRVSWARILHLFPQSIYNDRPLGSALERFLYERFGFDYERQLPWFLLLHCANCLLALGVFRRLGVRWPLALAGIALWASAWPTAATATYLGASFDVLCTLFLLASLLAITGPRPWHWALSAVFYLLALRSKEFGIVIPVFLTFLVALRLPPGLTWRAGAAAIGRRLWLHYLILIVFGACYLSLTPQLAERLPAGADYHMAFSFSGVLKAYRDYAVMPFHFNHSRWYWDGPALLVGLILAAALRRQGLALFALATYALTLLPVCLLPNIRSEYYVYCPLLFLLLALCLLAQDRCVQPRRSAWTRLAATACIAFLLLGLATSLRRSRHFRDGLHWTWSARGAGYRSAADLAALHIPVAAGAHFYINSGSARPWLFLYGPCYYLRTLLQDDTVLCVVEKPEPALRDLYARDPAPEKYWLDYAPDGALHLRPGIPASTPSSTPNSSP